MNLMCLLGRHSFVYKGDPPHWRMCVLCYVQERLQRNEWVRG